MINPASISSRLKRRASAPSAATEENMPAQRSRILFCSTNEGLSRQARRLLNHQRQVGRVKHGPRADDRSAGSKLIVSIA